MNFHKGHEISVGLQAKGSFSSYSTKVEQIPKEMTDMCCLELFTVLLIYLWLYPFSHIASEFHSAFL